MSGGKIKIVVAENAGYCGGARRAMELAARAASESGDVFSLGPLLHNPAALRALLEMGVRMAVTAEAVPRGSTVILRAHGCAPNEIATLRERDARVVDAVCPFVAGIHKKILALNERGAAVYIAGDSAHAETVAHASLCENHGGTFASADEARAADLPNGCPAALVAQTSMDRAAFSEIAAALSARVPGIEIHETLCEWMRKARESAARVARESDLMIVVGGRSSANTARLADVCREAGARVLLVESASELAPEHVRGVARAGVTAGASTPPESIQRVVQTLESTAAQL